MNDLSLQDSSKEQPAESAVPDLNDIPDIDDDIGGAGVTEPEDEATASQAATGNTNVDSSGATLSVRTYDCFITYDKYYQTPRMWLSGLSPARQPLTTEEIFQDISSDYAQKTVTIEPFPHKEGVSMASVHPCKHANVMKKVIERMNGAVKEQQRKQKEAMNAGAGLGNTTEAETDKKEKKKGWGITSAVKKATGVGAAKAPKQEEDEVEGLRVDQCMISASILASGFTDLHAIDLLVFLKFLSNVVPTIELDATTSL